MVCGWSLSGGGVWAGYGAGPTVMSRCGPPPLGSGPVESDVAARQAQPSGHHWHRYESLRKSIEEAARRATRGALTNRNIKPIYAGETRAKAGGAILTGGG